MHLFAPHLPLLTDVLNRRFFYMLCVNTFLNILGLWLLAGGGQNDIYGTSYAVYLLKCIIPNCILFFCVFYTLCFVPYVGIILQYCLVFCYFTMALIEIFLFLVFDAQLNTALLSIFLSTNTQEAREFALFYALDTKVVVSLFCFIVCSVCFFLIAKYIRPLQYFPALTNRAIALVLYVASCVLITIAFCIIYKNANKETIFYWVAERNIITRYYHTISKSFFEKNSFIKQYQDINKAIQNNITTAQDEILNNQSKIPNVIVIIGESTQRGYMSLYGYPLPTTPYLEALRRSGNLVVFDNVISPHAHTDKSIQKILTFSHYENDKIPWFMQQNLLDILNFAEYQTYWLSNQEAVSIYGNAPATIAQRAKITRFTKIDDSYTTGLTHDELLLPILDHSLTNPLSHKNFYAIHLMGTHAMYKARYPQHFKHFTQKTLRDAKLDTIGKSSTKLTEHQLLIRSQYLNAVLYNDFIVNEIIKRFSDTDSIIIYLSDHGEEVYDKRDFAGHSESNPSHLMVEVPFVVYMSESFKIQHPNLVIKIKNAQNHPFMTDDFIHAVLDLLEIQSKDSIPTRSLFNENYNADRARLINGVDYDKVLK